MKHTTKLLSLALALLMLVSVFTGLPLTAGAVTIDINSSSYYETSGDFEYGVLQDGTVEIKRYKGNEKELEIPDTIEGYDVTSIYLRAFDGCENLEKVIIPDTVTSIDDDAFAGCKNLSMIIIPDTVTSIGMYAFDNTAWYDEKPDGLVYAGKVAYKCKGDCPEEVVLIEGTTGIADKAFENCEKLESITIPDGVTVIGEQAFHNCIRLLSIEIPKSVIKIGFNALGRYTYEEERIDPETGNLIHSYISKGIENFTIKGYSDTAARSYAMMNGIKFIYLDKPSTPAKTTVTLKSKPNSLYVKEKGIVEVTVKNGKGATTYKSSDKKIAKINTKGKITALKKGTVTITVKNNGVVRKCVVKVKNPKLNKTRKNLKKGRGFTLVITGGVGEPKFTSNNKKIATVANYGYVQAKKKGLATITVKTNGMKLKCKIKVT